MWFKRLRRLAAAVYRRRALGYRQGEAVAPGNVGLVYSDKGDLDSALKHFQAALKIHRKVEYRQGEASDLGSIDLV